MAAKILSIELGDRLIKVCERGGAKNHIGKHFTFLTPEGLVSDGQLNDPAALGAALKAALSENGLSLRKRAVFVLQSGKVASREVKLPPVRDNRLRGMVESNASEYFPIDMSKYHITYTVLERKDKGEDPYVKLQVLAVPLAMLESYFQLADAAGLTVETIDYAGTARFSVLKGLKSEEVTMYVDVGCTTSDVLIMHKGSLMMQRSFPVGGDELIYAQLGASGKGDGDYLEAINALRRGESALTPEVTVESLNRLTSNIVRIADYFNSNNWETPVERLVLLGDCAPLTGFLPQVEESVTCPVELMAELPTHTGGAHPAPLDSGYLACAGCPLQRSDFLPESMGRQKKRRSRRAASDSIALGVIVCVGCLLIGGALTLTSWLDYNAVVREHDAVQAEIDALAPVEALYQSYIDYDAAADAFETVYAAADTPNADLLDFIAELERKMPSEIAVLSAVCTDTNVSMNITVGSKEAAAVVLIQLRSFESLADVSTGAVSELTDDNGITQVSFAVSCVYGTAADQAAAQ